MIGNPASFGTINQLTGKVIVDIIEFAAGLSLYASDRNIIDGLGSSGGILGRSGYCVETTARTALIQHGFLNKKPGAGQKYWTAPGLLQTSCSKK